jgi:hypothetical protein
MNVTPVEISGGSGVAAAPQDSYGAAHRAHAPLTPPSIGRILAAPS